MVPSLTVDNKNNQRKDNKTDDGNLALVIILLVGCVLAILLIVNGLTWISKFVRRKCGNLVNARDDYILETVYMEINAGFEQQESEPNTIEATVITRSCTSLDGAETGQELPEDQNPCHAHTNEDDEIYFNV